jgi:hypothetical protein
MELHRSGEELERYTTSKEIPAKHAIHTTFRLDLFAQLAEERES